MAVAGIHLPVPHQRGDAEPQPFERLASDALTDAPEKLDGSQRYIVRRWDTRPVTQR